jgi:hypothetical protein
MKKITTIRIYLFLILGFFIILINTCKKGREDGQIPISRCIMD